MSFVQTPKPSRSRSSRSGFTLIEAALVTTIISFGVLAMLQLLAVGTVSNSDGAEMSTAINLAKSVREMMIGMAIADPQTPTHWGSEAGENLSGASGYDDIDDFDGKSYSPPIDARRASIAALPDWSQSIRVQTVDPNLLTSTVPNGTTAAVRVTVTVSHNGKQITSYSWVAFDAAP
jgi:type II secretory pathway pseudopilin PulG